MREGVTSQDSINSRGAIMPLTVTNFDPGHGDPGTTVTINGTGFERGIRVYFYVDSESQHVAFVSDRRITATVPLSASTGVIRVKNPNNDEASSAASFTVDEPPDVHIQNFSPKQGATSTQVTIGGQGFKSNMAVKFGNTRATQVVWSSEMKIVATVPAGTPKGNQYIHVGTAVSASPFLVV